MPHTSKAFQALKQFSTCDIGDALVKLCYPYGGFLNGLRMRSPVATPTSPSTLRIHGPAVTVKMIEVERYSPSQPPAPPLHFADANRPDSIMYIQQPKGLYSACWGGLMSTRAKAAGALGVVVDGRVRDLSEHRGLGFPVFSRDTSILGSAGFTRASEIDIPLQFKGDLWIHPGDILVGDEDGVVVIPPSLMEDVVELCRERCEIDLKTVEALKKGELMGPTIKRLRKYGSEDLTKVSMDAKLYSCSSVNQFLLSALCRVSFQYQSAALPEQSTHQSMHTMEI